MKLILLPRWVESALRAQGMQLSMNIADIEALSTILSPDDVAFYVHINKARGHFIGQAINDTFSNPFVKYDTHPVDPKPGTWEACYEQHVYGAKPDPQTVWFGSVLGFDAAETDVTAQPKLQADILSYDTLVIRPVQRTKGDAAEKDTMQTLHSRLLSLLYTQTSFEALASNALFSTWIRGMRNSV